MTGAVAVFVKTPGLTAPKTRLAASIGLMRRGNFIIIALMRWKKRSAGF